MLIENLVEYNFSKKNEVILPRTCPFVQSEKGINLTNYASGKKTTDVLHIHSSAINCSESSCSGALMKGQSCAPGCRSKEEVLQEALKFQEQYFSSLKTKKTKDFTNRMTQIRDEIAQTGSYTLTYDELHFGARLAWRNASRCIGRIQWNKLHVFDCRNVTSTGEMYDALCKHLEYATNKGNIRSTITVFPPRIHGREDFRVWNAQLLSFAGYLQPDGTIVGDAGRVQFTRVCRRLGWKGKGGRFDILPWVLSAPGEGAKFYEIPEELVLKIDIEHPKYTWFKDLGIQWYGVPAVADMMFDVAGVSFTAAPFNGWYMATEIGARNLCDAQRYNITKEVAEKIGLDTMTHASLWKDLAMVETTLAVLYSYQKNKVTIVDHHTASDTFMKHIETEQTLRGGCPSDWVWIVPPISGSSTAVFHQEMINYNLKPSYEYQEKAWITYKWPKNDHIKLKHSFASIIKVVRICVMMMSKVRRGRTQATILYASETGKSETFAHKLENVLQASFNTRVVCMDDYNKNCLSSEDFVIAVTSTFGNGAPPDNGKDFWKNLKKIKERKDCLKKFKYAVFALGSRQYPNFCNFGKNVDKMFEELGGKRIMPVELGDELGGQEHTFNLWLPVIFKNACEEFNISITADMILPTINVNTWKSGCFRLSPRNIKTNSIITELAKLHHKKLFPAKMLAKINLQSMDSERQTFLARLKVDDSSSVSYKPGDHIAIHPKNPSHVVNAILRNLVKSGVNVDEVVEMESLKESTWNTVQRLPPASIKTYLSHYLDINTPPSSTFLLLLSEMAKDSFDKYRLKRLSEVTDDYEEWKSYKYPNLAEILEEFSSIKLDPTFLLSELPLLQPRYYSISSSQLASSKEIHITFSLVAYRTRDNRGPLHFGVCTSYLNAFPAEEIPFFIRPAHSFRLSEDSKLPIIMVGAGSGIAPFRSFWQEREALYKKCQEKESAESDRFGDMYLFFGCRQSTMDVLYQEETTALVNSKILTKTFVALSRELGQPKEYVQNKLEKECQLVLDVLLNDGHIYVCGDAVMATDVRATVNKILNSGKKCVDVDTLVESGRYHEDVFGVLHKK